MNIKQELQDLIESLSNDEISISKGLTKAKRINQKLKNRNLTVFIKGEMEGEYDDNTLPDYRYLFGETTFEFRNSINGMTDIRAIPMPEVSHPNGKSSNYRQILSSVSEIEQVVRENPKKETFKISFSSGQLSLAIKYLEQITDINKDWQLIRAWWSLSPTSMPAILFKAKQRLLDILLEIENSILENDFKDKFFKEKSHFDASFEVHQILENSRTRIILIDGYIDGTTLKLLSSKKESVKVQILTDPKSISTSLEVLIKNFNKQFKNLEVKQSKAFHDRFLIIDDIKFYQIGASMKDLGNKVFSLINLREPFVIEGLINKFKEEWNK